MASQSVRPRRDWPVMGGVGEVVRRMPKPLLSWFILVATAFVIAVVLLVWLLLWIARPRGGIEGWWIAQRGLALPVIGHQGDDLRRVSSGGSAASKDVTYRALEQALRGRLARAGSRPVVVYLSAAGVADDQGAFLLRPEPGSLAAYSVAGARQSLFRVESLVDLFGEYPSQKKLLILDAGQVGSDRDLGIFANGFLQALKAYLETKKTKGLAILCACAPGQVSMTSELDRRSVFGYFVEQGMSGRASGWDPSGRPGLTVRALSSYVRHQVSRWVAANRQAEQTPLMLGDPMIDFALPRTATRRAAAPADVDQWAEKLQKGLEEGWTRRDALQARKPFRHTPLLWQQYQETLLRAERLIRAGEEAEAEETLGNLPALEKKIVDAAAGLPMDPAWSLALLESHLVDHPSESRRGELKAVNDQIDAALKELASGTEEAGPPAAIEPGKSKNPPAVGSKTGGAASSEGDPGAEGAAPDAEGPKATEPSSPGVDPRAVGSVKVDAAKKTDTPAGAKPKGESALIGLIDRADEDRPRYVEAQLLVWADTFAKRAGASSSFMGGRGELLGVALQSRRLAEAAAASDERISRWVVPLVEAGDELRRRAQDSLFAGDAGQLERSSRWLEPARAHYRQAKEIAVHASGALDLVEQLEAELPFYGEWKARRGVRRDEGLDQEFVDLMKATAVLARQIGSEPSGEPTSRRGDGDDPLAIHLERVKKWEDQSQEVKAAFDRLRVDFQAQCAGLSTAGGSGRWREFDGVLRVPMLPVEVRRQLFRRIRSATVAGTLAGPDETASPSLEPRPAPGDPRGPARGQTEERLSDSRVSSREEVAEAVASAEGPSAPAPEFWKLALGLARLEWGLFEIGGASETDLTRLENAYQSAQGSLKGDPALAFDAFSKLADLIRALRVERLRAIRQGQGSSYAPLAATDRGVRVVPLADALGLSDKPTEELDRFRRQALLLWHGTRLLRDFAPGHARRLFEDAQHFMDTEALHAAIEDAVAMARAKLVVRPDLAEPLEIKEWADRMLDLSVGNNGPVPAGDATVVVGFDPASPVTITEKVSRGNAREGVLVPVHADQSPARIEYSVGRTESTPAPVALTLNPAAFYRGHIYPADRGVDVTLDSSRNPVTVTIQQSYEGVKFKDFTDQFKEHPGQGYLHFGTYLQYKLVLTAVLPMKVWVRYGFKEHPESYQTKPLEIGPGKRGEIHDVVKSNDFPIVKPDERLDVAPMNLLVTIWKDKVDGEIVGKSKYTFQMIPPSRYISTATDFDPGSRTLSIWVTHLGSDPVTGPVEIFASIGGRVESNWIRRSRIAPFEFPVPPGAKSVTWRVGIESIPAAFRETIETPSPSAAGEPAKSDTAR